MSTELQAEKLRQLYRIAIAAQFVLDRIDDRGRVKARDDVASNLRAALAQSYSPMTEVERAELDLLAHLDWVGWVAAEDERVTALRTALENQSDVDRDGG